MGFWISKRSIVLQFKCGPHRPKVYLGLLTDHWDAKKQRVPTRVDFAWEINQRLDRVEELVTDIRMEYKRSGFFPDPRKLENDILFITQPEVEANLNGKEKLVWEYVDTYIKRKEKLLTEGYLKNWPSFAEQVKCFDPLATFMDITSAWQERFADWLFRKEGLSQNTVHNKIVYVQVLARDARKLGYSIALDFEDFSIKEIHQPAVYLDWDTHVEQLRKIQLIQELEVVRDRFLFRCNTGMREGEMVGIKPGNFYQSKGDYLKYYDQKGKKWKIIALNAEALSLAKKYGNSFPRISQQEENRLIKQVGMIAGLNEPREKLTHLGGKVKREIIPLYQLISSHTARRTFARRWYENGGELIKLSRYLGHKDLKTTMVYIGLEDLEASEEMRRVMG